MLEGMEQPLPYPCTHQPGQEAPLPGLPGILEKGKTLSVKRALKKASQYVISEQEGLGACGFLLTSVP